jgi:hypothetical protein
MSRPVMSRRLNRAGIVANRAHLESCGGDDCGNIDARLASGNDEVYLPVWPNGSKNLVKVRVRPVLWPSILCERVDAIAGDI